MLQQLTNIPEWPVGDVVIGAYEFSRPEKKTKKLSFCNYSVPGNIQADTKEEALLV